VWGHQTAPHCLVEAEAEAHAATGAAAAAGAAVAGLAALPAAADDEEGAARESLATAAPWVRTALQPAAAHLATALDHPNRRPPPLAQLAAAGPAGPAAPVLALPVVDSAARAAEVVPPAAADEVCPAAAAAAAAAQEAACQNLVAAAHRAHTAGESAAFPPTDVGHPTRRSAFLAQAPDAFAASGLGGAAVSALLEDAALGAAVPVAAFV